MSTNSTPEEIIRKYLEGKCTPEEKAIVESWHMDDLSSCTDIPSLQEITDVHEQMHQKITAYSQKKTKRLWPRIAAAASILLAISVGGYLFLSKPFAASQMVALNAENIQPMNRGVILTIGGGKSLVLNRQRSGAIKTTDGANASQSPAELTYKGTDTAEPAVHTLTNNTSNKYKLRLTDGTEITLDVASAITYPVTFKGRARRVTISGQAYLKVVHDDNSPFYVVVGNQVIEDIGTEFNINAYSDEPVHRVTLIEGAVKVNRLAETILLHPGEEVIATATTLSRGPANLEKTLAWLQGKQIFNREPLENIMNHIARIYDVKLVWLDPETKKMKFGGSFDRTKKLSTVLNFLRKVGPDVDFLVDGKTVKIFKKKRK